MSEILRKRHSSGSYLTENIKHIKNDENVKENIPPQLCETNNLDENNTSLQDIKKITTPKKNREKLKEQPVTPSTNFKLLALLAADQDYVKCSTPESGRCDETSENQMSCDSDLSDLSTGKVNRKEKSLGIICTRFLAMYPIHPPADKRIIVSLDEVCVKLGVERRRLYDIVNVFESIDILTKNAKNQYLWFGKNNLFNSLCKLKAAAIKENILEKLQYVLKTDSSGCRSSCILSDVKNFNKTVESTDPLIFSPQISSALPEVRKEKSLGLMSQKFLMLFLVSSNKIISLGVAAKVLNGFLQRQEKGAQIKTQIRRLYDIANVLSSIGLIQKETAFSECGRKPAFKYIGPDVKDYKGDFSDKRNHVPQSILKGNKSRSLARHSSFQDICAVAEIEHQKLNLKESHNSAPPFDSALINEKENVKTSFENLQLNADANTKNITNINIVESKPKVKLPLLVKPNLKFINLKKPTASPSVPYLIINSMPVEKSDVKYTTSAYGTQTFFLINTIAPSKEVKTEVTENQPVSKVCNPQTITLSSEQRDAILQSLNISLSSEQIASIHLDGASQSNSLDVPCNVVKIINKNTPRMFESKNTVKISSQKDTELNSNGSISMTNTRSNTPSSMQTLDSPLSIPSGYVTPIPSVSSDISFASNVEVNDILKKIESQTNTEVSNSKATASMQENVNLYKKAVASSETENGTTYQIINAKENLVSNNYLANCPMNQINQLISNDSCSSDSVNLEVSNIFKGKNLGDASIKPKTFLIDEKTLLSPIKTSDVPGQVSVPSNLITPPYIVPETVFLFTTPPASYQKSKANDISNLATVVPNLLTERKKILSTNANLKL